MNFIEIDIKCNQELIEILMAELSNIGFDTMIEYEGGFKAYIDESEFSERSLIEILERYIPGSENWKKSSVKKENWNAEWEKNYAPIVIEGKCIVKATFHEIEVKYPFEITISPKMSFGTGHHETTYQILDLQTSIDHEDKVIMDAGCGTGVLAIMAELRGAKKVEAFDIDDWCIDNSNENFGLNNCTKCNVRQGTIDSLQFDEPFDIIIANINKNVLLKDMESFSNHLRAGGQLILSGFYETDLEDIQRSAKLSQLSFIRNTVRNNWVAAEFAKNRLFASQRPSSLT